jgi:hypothetical protein
MRAAGVIKSGDLPETLFACAMGGLNVPKEHLKIARRFNAGIKVCLIRVPKERLTFRGILSAVPPGLVFILDMRR